MAEQDRGESSAPSASSSEAPAPSAIYLEAAAPSTFSTESPDPTSSLEAPPSTTPQPHPQTFHLLLPESETGRFKDSTLLLNASLSSWLEKTSWTIGEAPCNLEIRLTQGLASKTLLLRRIHNHQKKLRKLYVKNKSTFDLCQTSYIIIFKGDLLNETVSQSVRL